MTKILRHSFYFKGRDFKEKEIIIVNDLVIDHIWICNDALCVVSLPYSSEFVDKVRDNS